MKFGHASATRSLALVGMLVVASGAARATDQNVAWLATGLGQPVPRLLTTVDASMNTPAGVLPGQHDIPGWIPDVALPFARDVFFWDAGDPLIRQRGGAATYTVQFADPIPANRLMLAFNDLAATDGLVTVSGGTADTEDFVALPVDETGSTPPYGSKPALAWDPANGTVSRTAGPVNHNVLLLLGSSSDTVVTITLSVFENSGDFVNLGVGVVSPIPRVPALPPWGVVLAVAGLAIAACASVRSSPLGLLGNT